MSSMNPVNPVTGKFRNLIVGVYAIIGDFSDEDIADITPRIPQVIYCQTPDS